MKEYLTKEEIAQNEDYFISLLGHIHRDGAKVDELIQKLRASDFFVAPATTQYYGSYLGGLCEHSIEVFGNLVALVEEKMLVDEKGQHYELQPEDELFESIIIIGLLHDICKMNRFEETTKNVKKYVQGGKNKDDKGSYNWESESFFQARSLNNRFIYGSDGETSEYMVRQFIPLTLEESVAIINSKGDTDNNQTRGSNLGAIFSKYNLPLLLHCADLMACYIDDPTNKPHISKARVNEQETY